jgi:hypothetical protein
MDIHLTQRNIGAINSGSENGIVKLSFSPHRTHEVQPLDVAFYGASATTEIGSKDMVTE